MLGCTASLALLVAVGLIAVLQMDAVAAGPIGRTDALGKKSDQNMSTEQKKGNDVVVIFASSCAGHGTHEFLISKEENGCYNVGNPSVSQIIKTRPEGIQLQMFDQPHCDGKPHLYGGPGDTAAPNQSSQSKLPFQVSSFMISRD